METLGWVVISWMVADLIVGIFHWWEDQYVDQDWPVIGLLIGGPNQLHHSDPLHFTHTNYWQRNWTTFIGAALLLLILPQRWWLIAVFVSQSNEIHAWAHQRCNWFIRMWQESGIMQHPRNHAAHHRVPFSRRYCVMSDWLNPLLDTFHVWRVVEWLVFLVSGVKPRSWESVT